LTGILTDTPQLQHHLFTNRFHLCKISSHWYERFEDTNEVTRIRNSKDRQEEFEDTKWEIRMRISKKNRQHNSQKKWDKQRSTKHTHKTKDRAT
jgi:hypothetical protein